LADSWLTLSREDQAEALEVASAQTGRPPHLLEKDIWVVWTLSAIYESALAEKLTFKGGTSLSKVYKIIDRFSEDIDLTCDIREVVPELLRNGNPIPDSPSQAKKSPPGFVNDCRNGLRAKWFRFCFQPCNEMGCRPICHLLAMKMKS
jgi:hypothetical protein